MRNKLAKKYNKKIRHVEEGKKQEEKYSQITPKCMYARHLFQISPIWLRLLDQKLCSHSKNKILILVSNDWCLFLGSKIKGLTVRLKALKPV